MNDMTKNIVLWLVIAGVLYVVASSINTQPTQQMLNYSAFIDNVENGNVDQVTIGDTRISGQMNDGTRFETVKPPAMDTNLIPTLIQNEVDRNIAAVGARLGQSVWQVTGEDLRGR